MAFLGANVERYFIQVLGAQEQFHLVRMEGKESISQLFQFNVELVCEDPELAIETLVGQAAVITIMDATVDGSELIRYMHGIVSQMEIGQLGISQTTYYLTVVPKIWPMSYRQNSRIFQNKSVQQIITTLLTEAGLQGDEFRFELQNTPPARDYCVQYQETDLQFISRLLEEEGEHYYFEHLQEKHVLVISDTSNSNPKIIPEDQLNYFYDRQGEVSEQHIYDFRYIESIKSGKVSIRDYEFKKPRMQLKEDNEAQYSTELEVYDYPGLFKDSASGKHYAARRLEALNRFRKRATAASDINTIVPGYSFILDGHERDELNSEYLITNISHQCSQTQVLEVGATDEGTKYSNQFSCIPFDIPFRPGRNTAKPKIRGTQTAIITGPAGEELYTDEFGRVKVQFHWDREGQSNEQSSCWIRVSQPSSGAGFGGFFLPRIGEEVIVDFLEGDPDKPMVIGRIYHGTNRPPYALPQEKTKSTIKSNSSKGGDGFNELRFEDKKGEEQLFMHGEKDKDLRVKNDTRTWVGHDRHQITVTDSSEEIQGDSHSHIIEDQVLEVQGNSDRTYESDLIQETQGSEHYTVADQHIMEVNGSTHLKVANSQKINIGTKLSVEVGDSIHHQAGTAIILDAGSNIRLKAGGSFITLGSSGVSVSGSSINVIGGTVNIISGTININQGGSAGSAASAAPTRPAMPNLPAIPDAPELAEEGFFSPQAQAMLTRKPIVKQCKRKSLK
ncbi:MAG: type VI secretion system tip protein VgrG [Oceanospirillaceae bacterium]|nr:type VI secretion system tip protein VgrG [Oceanospirillaceae bacterium]